MHVRAYRVLDLEQLHVNAAFLLSTLSAAVTWHIDVADEAEGQAAATQQAGSSLSSSQALGSTSDDMPVLSASSSSSQGTSFGNLAAQNLGQSGSASEDSVVRSDSDYSATTNNMQGQDHSIKDSLTQQTDSATELADGSNSGSSLAGGAAESGVLTANEALDLAS